MYKFLNLIDRCILPLIWTSIILLFVELSTGSSNSLDSNMKWFLWIERGTACIFLIEYVCRWVQDHRTDSEINIGHSYYPLSVLGIIDLLSFLPFLIGFFVPLGYLGWIRSLRILRAFKLFRYSRTLQLFALSIYKSLWFLKAVGFVCLVFGLLGSALIYQAEKEAQPELFGNISNIFWFVIVSDSTVGYGDMSPITPLGKILTGILIFLPGIAVFGSVMGIIGTSLGEVMKLEKDPNFDPIQEFKNNVI